MQKRIIDPPIIVSWRQTFFGKLRGYMGRSSILRTEGLALVEKHAGIVNTSIHMMFVYTPLAVFWLDPDNKVIHKVIAKPWDAYHSSKLPAKIVFETHPDHIDQWQVGDKIEFNVTD